MLKIQIRPKFKKIVGIPRTRLTKSPQIVPYFGKTFVDEPLPKNGYVDLDPNKHGFGVTLNPELKLRDQLY